MSSLFPYHKYYPTLREFVNRLLATPFETQLALRLDKETDLSYLLLW